MSICLLGDPASTTRKADRASRDRAHDATALPLSAANRSDRFGSACEGLIL